MGDGFAVVREITRSSARAMRRSGAPPDAARRACLAFQIFGHCAELVCQLYQGHLRVDFFRLARELQAFFCALTAFFRGRHDVAPKYETPSPRPSFPPPASSLTNFAQRRDASSASGCPMLETRRAQTRLTPLLSVRPIGGDRGVPPGAHAERDRERAQHHCA